MIISVFYSQLEVSARRGGLQVAVGIEEALKLGAVQQLPHGYLMDGLGWRRYEVEEEDVANHIQSYKEHKRMLQKIPHQNNKDEVEGWQERFNRLLDVIGPTSKAFISLEA